MLLDYPDTFKYAHPSLNDMVLSKAGIVTEVHTGSNGHNATPTVKVHVCTECWDSLNDHGGNGRMPKVALANNLFRGPVPKELEGLTLAEQILISRYRTRVYLIKLVADGGKGDPATRQTALKGSVCSFEQHVDKAINLLPSSPDTLVDQVAVLFVGVTKPKAADFRKVLEVRREKVRAALMFLAKHIPAYRNIISQAAIDKLPESGVPQVVADTIVHAAREETETATDRSYVPCTDEDMETETAQQTEQSNEADKQGTAAEQSAEKSPVLFKK
jgi:hypothetical protein